MRLPGRIAATLLGLSSGSSARRSCPPATTPTSAPKSTGDAAHPSAGRLPLVRLAASSMVSYNEHYSGGYVGGGQGRRRAARAPTRGPGAGTTRRSDHRPRRIFLGWSNGRRYQGGTGRYRTDGPKPIEHRLRGRARRPGSGRIERAPPRGRPFLAGIALQSDDEDGRGRGVRPKWLYDRGFQLRVVDEDKRSGFHQRLFQGRGYRSQDPAIPGPIVSGSKPTGGDW